MIDLKKLEERIGIHFNDTALLKEAFTHKTYSRENNTHSYERLEFLGDSLLNFLVGDYLFSNSEEATDYKARLQEMVQKEHHSNGVDYRCVEIDAQAVGDEDRFEARVYILGRPVASGRGRNKKKAQSRAAAQAIRKLEHGEA